MTPKVENFAKCGCGHTQDPDGLCDGSHAFIEEHDDSDAESVFDDDWHEEEKPLEVVFVPGCFDDFDGTQEELDALIKEIQNIVASGKLDTVAEEIDFDTLLEEEPELAAKLLEESNKRNLQ